jgi:hypothetical protein
MDVHKVLTMGAVIVAAAALAGTAGAASATGGTPAPVATTTMGFIPDPGVAITTDPSKAPTHKGLTASPRVLCGTCSGGGNVQGCVTVYVNNGDGYGNWVKAYYHWCWLNGAISNNYGWGDEAACWGFCTFQGWNYNFDFGNGHQDKATFRDVSGGIFHVDSADAACVAVDGWGNSWGC